MLPEKFKPKATYQLTRIGSKNDGGYLVEKESLESTKSLLSFGVSTDWNFEREFLEHNPVPLEAYDHQVQEKDFLMIILASLPRFLTHFRKPLQNLKALKRSISLYRNFKRFFRGSKSLNPIMVGYNHEHSKSLSEILKNPKLIFPLFLKCDIEGWEYRILDDLISHAHLMTGLVIEFHNIDLHRERLLQFIEDFPLELVHTSPNNNGEQDQSGNPLVIEMTFARSPHKVHHYPTLPHPEDAANNPMKRNYTLAFAEDKMEETWSHV